MISSRLVGSVLIIFQSLVALKSPFKFSTLSKLTNYKQSIFSRNMATKSDLPSDRKGWEAILTPSQFKVLRMKATEPSGFSESTPGELEFELKKKVGTKYPKEGQYECVACGTPLYKATTKFDSGCGWPAFYVSICDLFCFEKLLFYICLSY